ncbi:hypothetical protein KM043_016772 [Ampulex compressa]|nr:hypothetical protein KM043_016772 [Ampulex compressa]
MKRRKQGSRAEGQLRLRIKCSFQTLGFQASSNNHFWLKLHFFKLLSALWLQGSDGKFSTASCCATLDISCTSHNALYIRRKLGIARKDQRGTETELGRGSVHETEERMQEDEALDKHDICDANIFALHAEEIFWKAMQW